MFNGERMAELRKDMGLTQAELAEHLDIAVRKISKYETGENIPPDEIKIALAKFFDISLDYLMGLTDEELTYRRAANIIRYPKGFPTALVPKLQEFVDLLFAAYKYNAPKK